MRVFGGASSTPGPSLHRLRIADELVARDRAHHAAAFHQVVILRARERIRLAGVDDLEAAAEPQRVRGAKRVGVEAGAGADAARARPAVARDAR